MTRPDQPDPAEWFGVRHVVEPGWRSLARTGGSDAAMLACAAHLQASPPPARRPALVAAIATSRGADSARALGLNVADVVPTGARPRWAPPRAPRREGHQTDVLWHAALPPRAGRRAVLRAFGAPDPRLAPIGRRAARVDVFTERDRLAWAEAGVGARISPLPDLGPLAAARAARRAEGRARLGLDSETVIALMADRPEDVDARQFGFLLGLLAVAGHRVAGLMPAAARSAHLVRRHIVGLHEPCRVFESGVSMLAAVEIADLALVPPSVEAGSGAELVFRRWCELLGVRMVPWAQQPAGERRQTPALAAPVIAALEAASPRSAATLPA